MRFRRVATSLRKDLISSNRLLTSCGGAGHSAFVVSKRENTEIRSRPAFRLFAGPAPPGPPRAVACLSRLHGPHIVIPVTFVQILRNDQVKRPPSASACEKPKILSAPRFQKSDYAADVRI